MIGNKDLIACPERILVDPQRNAAVEARTELMERSYRAKGEAGDEGCPDEHCGSGVHFNEAECYWIAGIDWSAIHQSALEKERDSLFRPKQ